MRMRLSSAVIILAFCLLGAAGILNTEGEPQVSGQTTTDFNVIPGQIVQAAQAGATQIDSEVTTVSTDLVVSAISQNLGLPYKDFGFKDVNGAWVRFDGSYDYSLDQPGYNCAGFVAQVVRDLYGDQITLEQLAEDRDVQGEIRDTSGGDRALFGRDMIRNIADLTGGHSIASPGESIDNGFRPHQFQTLWLNVQIGKIYFLDVYKDTGSRLDFHVAVMAPTEDGVMVYEATNYWAPGQPESSSALPLEDFLNKYSDSKYGILAVECPLPQL